MSRTNKDKPWKFRIVKKRKKHGRLLRDRHLMCDDVWCCGLDSRNPRALEKKEWHKEVGEEIG